MKVLFVSDYKYEVRDGLFEAINLLKYDRFNIGSNTPNFASYDFILGHGAFGSRVDLLLQTLPNKKGLCIAGRNKVIQYMMFCFMKQSGLKTS